jgi:hypothetical protein
MNVLLNMKESNFWLCALNEYKITEICKITKKSAKYFVCPLQWLRTGVQKCFPWSGLWGETSDKYEIMAKYVLLKLY